MLETTNEQFEEYVSDAIDAIPGIYSKGLKNVAFIVEDEPSPEQRKQLGLHCNQSLFGLYQGVPLPARGGREPLLPDKITIFKNPILNAVSSLKELNDQVGRTVWHEVAHFYGLDHKRIHELEKMQKRSENQ